MASTSMTTESQASFTHPPEWTDGERMNFLLAPFPLNKIPSPNDAKITFWSSLIINSSRELKKPFFTERELLSRLKWKQTTSPGCLAVVIQTMENSGSIMKLSTFSQAVSGSWFAWGMGIAMKPVSWALKNYLPSSQYDGEYIINSLIKEYANTVVAEHKKVVVHKSTDNLMKLSTFESLCQRVVNTPDVHRIIELQLIKERKICRRGEVVKFVSEQQRPEVTDTDIGIMSIKETVDNLTTQLQLMEEKSASWLEEKFKQMTDKGYKYSALNYLRRNKVLREYIHKREALLDNVQTILHQIQSAETDSVARSLSVNEVERGAWGRGYILCVFKAYKTGAAAIKSLREAEGLTIDSAEEAISSLKEAVEESEEITNALSTANDTEEQVTDEELEQELLDLLSPEKGSNAIQPSVLVPDSKASPSVDDSLIDQLSSLTVSRHSQDKTGNKQPQVEHKAEKKVLLPA